MTQHFKIIILSFFILTVLQSATAAKVRLNINNEIITRLEQDIRNDKYGKITGIVILDTQGRIVYDKYFKFCNRYTLNQISSVSKSIISLLLGKCLDSNLIQSIDTPIYEYFPEYADIFEKDTIKKLITIRNLLNQTTGLKFNEWNYPYNYASNSLIAVVENNFNWIDFFMNLPVDTLPGTKFSYNSLSSQIIAEIISRISKKPFNKLVEEQLFVPLKITDYQWDFYGENGYPAWGGIHLTTYDMAKFGLIMLDNGHFGNTQVVSSQWIKESTANPVHFNNNTLYGLQWWIDLPTNDEEMIYAAGYGDQYVFVCPEKGMVVAINANNFTDYHWPKSTILLAHELIEAVIPEKN